MVCLYTFFDSKSFAEIPSEIYFDNLATEGSYVLMQPAPGRYLCQIYCFCALCCNRIIISCQAKHFSNWCDICKVVKVVCSN